MKKIIFSTMIASLLAFVGCQNEELVNDNNTDNSGKKVILTANIQGAADSRVALTPDTDENENPIVKVDWRTFDSTNPETFVVYDLDELNDPTTFTQLSGNVFEGDLPESSYGYCAYYNYALWISIVETQKFPQDGTLREQDVLMYAEFYEDATSIEFDHRTAILKPTFTLFTGGEWKSINSTITNIELDGLTLGGLGNVDITVTRTSQEMPLAEDIYMTIPFDPYCLECSSFEPEGIFTFSVKADGTDYTGSFTIPQIDDWYPCGKLFTATIALTEVNACFLPEPDIFKQAILAELDKYPQLTKIEFKANSNVTSETQIGTCGAYLVANEETLEIHTSKSVFVFPENCASMFNGTTFYNGNQPLLRVTSIKFNNCVNTSNVTSMSNMFRSLSALKELDLSCFDTSNVTDMFMMFAYSSKLEMLNLSSFNVDKVTDFTNMLWMMSELENGKKTQVYVPNPNPFEDKNTGINNNIQQKPADSEYAEYVIGTPQ